MAFSISNRALLRGMLAGAVVLAACSRSDRSENTATISTDTLSNETAEPEAARPTADTGTATGAVTDTGSTAPAGNAPRANTAAPRSGQQDATLQKSPDSAAGYRGMERDTSAQGGQPARVTEDTSETSVNTPDTTGAVETAGAADVSDTTAGEMAPGEPPAAAADTSVAGYSAMARDTVSTTPEQADTVSQAEGDVALQARIDTTHAEADVNVEADVAPAGEADTATIQAQVDTTAEPRTEVAVQDVPDTVTVVGDSSSVDKPGPRAKEDTVSIKADSLAKYHEAERVRPPEDSMEALDRETVADAEARTDEVGAAPLGGDVTGADAVSLMTRQGAKCIVIDPESNEAVRWDMSSTPATLNPCGMGSMNLSKIWTAGQRGSEAAGQ
jgi:hypothetical protein